MSLQSKQTDRLVSGIVESFIIENVMMAPLNCVSTCANQSIHGANKLLRSLLSPLPEDVNNNLTA